MTEELIEAFNGTRTAGSIASGALDEITKIIKPGITTNKIDKICFDFINDHGAYSAPLFYRGFPKSSCTSINHVVCHGIPKNKILVEGDILNVDVTAQKKGWHGDTSRMYFVGEVSVKANKLVRATYDAMVESIKILKNGCYLGDLGFTIQNYVESQGFSVVQDFCGHGTGKKFHQYPNILHYGEKGTGDKLKTGMIFTIEPMINEGGYETKILNDGWTAVTKDKTLSAQFEHTLGITEDSYEIFTESVKEYRKPPYN